MSKVVSDNIKIRFYYWNARGRSQSIRYMLEDIAAKHKNVDYKEDFEAAETRAEIWPQRKTDETISGPFRNLPVLHWNDTHTFGQTIPIGQFLARNFNLYGQLTPSITDKNILQTYLDGVVSCSYLDVIELVLRCIISNLDFENPNDPNVFLAQLIPSNIKVLNNLLQQSSTSFFYDQIEPTIADYFAFEAYTIARDFHPKVLPKDEDCQALKKLEQVMKERPGLANYFNKGLLSKRFTASPKEHDYMIKLGKTKN